MVSPCFPPQATSFPWGWTSIVHSYPLEGQGSLEGRTQQGAGITTPIRWSHWLWKQKTPRFFWKQNLLFLVRNFPLTTLYFPISNFFCLYTSAIWKSRFERRKKRKKKRVLEDTKLCEISLISRLSLQFHQQFLCNIAKSSHWCWFEVVIGKRFFHVLKCQSWMNYSAGLAKILFENWSSSKRQTSVELYKSTINDFFHIMHSPPFLV